MWHRTHVAEASEWLFVSLHQRFIAGSLYYILLTLFILYPLHLFKKHVCSTYYMPSIIL